MAIVIGVKFRSGSRVYYFDPGELPIEQNDGVIVETARGEEYGDVVNAPMEVEEDKLVSPLKPVLRIATPEDKRQREYYAQKEFEAMSICQEKIDEHKLDMKLVDVEYTYNGSKLVFYFTADERVDFRELVKDLAYVFKTRIELRQIGVRDEAKMLGGLGPCGRPVCCKAFLDDFRPVSIKMAKEQSLSLSPTKISGLCGRLMCCLQYEQSAYEYMHKLMPREGKEIETPDGIGTVVENNVLKERTKVRITAQDGSFEIKEYPYAILGPGASRQGEQAAPLSESKQPDTVSDKPKRERASRGDRAPKEKQPRGERTKQEQPGLDKPKQEPKSDKGKQEQKLTQLPGESLSGRLVLPGESLSGSTVMQDKPKGKPSADKRPRPQQDKRPQHKPKPQQEKQVREQEPERGGIQKNPEGFKKRRSNHRRPNNKKATPQG